MKVIIFQIYIFWNIMLGSPLKVSQQTTRHYTQPRSRLFHFQICSNKYYRQSWRNTTNICRCVILSTAKVIRLYYTHIWILIFISLSILVSSFEIFFQFSDQDILEPNLQQTNKIVVSERTDTHARQSSYRIRRSLSWATNSSFTKTPGSSVPCWET